MASGDGKFSTDPAPPEYYGDRDHDHAIRLRSLEGSYADLNAQLAANTVQLEGVNDGVARMTDQLVELHRVITTSVPTIARDVEALKSVEAKRVEKRNKRRAFISRYASGALVALSAAGITKFLPLLLGYLHR
jgi:hypothetical protein